jgi:predicted pyridoxine 5'-phosphate oxidase superfamily flavin-nucleotide-binding protein
VRHSHGEEVLQQRYGTDGRASRFYREQMLDHLNPAMIDFVRRMEMAFIATADSRGNCDSSLRAGPPGFLHVISPHQLAYPEYRGNGVLASLGNITENGHIGLMLIDFEQDVIGLHVNGFASVVSDEQMRREVDDLPTVDHGGRTPERWVLVTVQEAYIHCRKHIPRMVAVPRDRSWGTDDPLPKGGDYFGVCESRGVLR